MHSGTKFITGYQYVRLEKEPFAFIVNMPPHKTLCKTRKRAFCFYCKYATTQNTLTFGKRAEPTFSISGFNNWLKAVAPEVSYSSSQFISQRGHFEMESSSKCFYQCLTNFTVQ